MSKLKVFDTAIFPGEDVTILDQVTTIVDAFEYSFTDGGLQQQIEAGKVLTITVQQRDDYIILEGEVK